MWGLLLGWLMLASIAQANELVVQGRGDARISPDIAYLYLGVETRELSAQDAVAKNGAAMAQLLRFFQGLGIPDDKIKTVEYSLWKREEYQEGGALTFLGYQVVNVIEVPVKELARVGAILDGAVAAGANVVRNVEYGVEDMEAAQESALIRALRDARRKAEVICAEASLEILGINRIQELSTYGPYFGAEGGAPSALPPTPLMPGQLKLEAMVEVEFQVTPK